MEKKFVQEKVLSKKRGEKRHRASGFPMDSAETVDIRVYPCPADSYWNQRRT